MTATSDPVTLSAVGCLETGKIGETDSVSNHDFLRAVFKSVSPGVNPVVVSFRGNPETVPGKAWSCMPWQNAGGQLVDLPTDANN